MLCLCLLAHACSVPVVWGFLRLKGVDGYGKLLNSCLQKLKIGIIILTKVNILF
jgi:hypothetical protein